VFTLALASATVLMAIRSTHFLYLLYIVVSLLVGMVALSTLVWMLNAWRTPHSLTESQLKADGRETVHSFSLIVPARHEEAVLEHTLSRLISSDHPDFEILVVVGHDDPGTREVAERVANRYPDCIKVIVDPSKAAAFHSLTWANSGWRASRARLWNHRERAWWRRVQASQWMTSHRGRGRVVRAASSRLISGMVSGIMPGSAGGG
jgi:hypothetical protein